ncbi:MAG TPA: multidrug efflux SMR transporter [Gammaproteobacteria bacterium]
MPRAWLYLLSAGALEIVWLIALKYSAGFTRFWPTALLLLSATLSFYLASLALKTLPAGTVYAVWTGIGVAGGAVAGMLLFNESREFLRLLSLALIIMGIVGLKLTQGR